MADAEKPEQNRHKKTDVLFMMNKAKFSFLGLLAILTVFMFMTSCQKEHLETNPESTEIEEGFRSTTDNTNNESYVEDSTTVEEPLLHMSFDGKLSKEEVEAQWKQAVTEFMRDYEAVTIRGYSTEWFSSIRTRTGPQTHNDTDAAVYARLNFLTNQGYTTQGWYHLNTPNDDREKGQWDYFLVRNYLPGLAVSWVEARWGQLALLGTDGWFVTDFDVHLHTSDQTIQSSGASHIYSNPYVWLDNPTSSEWDYYYTGVVGYGRLNF